MRPAFSMIPIAFALVFVACSGESSSGQIVGGTVTDPTTPAAPTETASTTQATGGTMKPPAAPLPQGSKPVRIRARDFTTGIDNPYWPMTPGSRWFLEETDATGATRRVVVTVLHRKRTIFGVETRVVHDQITQNGQLTEDTFDWYAQDKAGNLWYFGEDTTEYANGQPATKEGSWEAGVDGAQPGVIIPGNPKPGMHYREEYYAGHAEDRAEILGLNGRARVPYGNFKHLLHTRNFTPLEPNLVEEKFYAREVGPVLEITVSGGSDRTELLILKRG